MGQAADHSKESGSSNSRFLSSDNYKRSQSRRSSSAEQSGHSRERVGMLGVERVVRAEAEED